MKGVNSKNQKKYMNKTLKQFRFAKRVIQLSITGTVSVITASLSFYFCPGFSSQVVDEVRSGIYFVQNASHRKFQELEDFLKTEPDRTGSTTKDRAFKGYFRNTGSPRYIFYHLKDLSGNPW